MSRPLSLHRHSEAATISSHTGFTVVNRELVTAKALDAADSPRGRDIHILHRGDADTLQRMINAMQPGTYVRPHRHLHPPKAETFVLLQGQAGFVMFDDAGEVLENGSLLLDGERGSLAVDVREGVWHMVLCLAPDTVLFEAKPGPYTRTHDKDFASWSPPEGSPDALVFLAEVEDRFRLFWKLPPRHWQV